MAGDRSFGVGGLAALLALVAGATALLAYAVIEVPVMAAQLPGGEALRHWPVAAVAALTVVLVGALTVAVSRRRPRASISDRADRDDVGRPAGRLDDAAGVGIPRPLRLERIRGRAAVAAGAASAAVLGIAIARDFPLWGIVLATLTPWAPLFVREGIWKYKHYGFYAIFATIALLQVGHLGEHTVQVLQLLLTGGDLARSHGVFGQLDFETVHFVWDTTIWLVTGMLIYKIGGRSRWLWLSFAAASVHEVEHIYLFWIYLADPGFYLRGGFAGLMGMGGLIGSPLARAYLHFAYNFLVVVPMVLAFWDYGRRVHDRFLARALPKLSETELITATALAGRLRVAGNDVIANGGGVLDRLYVVAQGEIEITQRGKTIAVLRQGQSFDARGVVGAMAARAPRGAELLLLGPPAFTTGKVTG